MCLMCGCARRVWCARSVWLQSHVEGYSNQPAIIILILYLEIEAYNRELWIQLGWYDLGNNKTIHFGVTFPARL